MFQKIVLIILVYFELCFTRTIFKIDRLDVCGTIDKPVIHIQNNTIHYSPKIGYYIDMDMEIFRDLLSDKLYVNMSVIRCANKEALDSCEYFMHIKLPPLCKFLNLPAMGWEGICAGFTPPMKCPFKKGLYHGRNLTFYPDVFKWFPVRGYHWKAKGDIYEGTAYLGSLCLEASIL